MIVVDLIGGLGNQMFEYAFGRALQLQKNEELLLNTFNFTNSGHNRYSLNEYCFSQEINAQNIGRYGGINRFQKIALMMFNKSGDMIESIFKSNASRYDFENTFERILNKFNVYFERSGPVKVDPHATSKFKKTLINGFWQDYSLFNSIRPTLKDDFELLNPINTKLLPLVELIKNTNSVCIHIRRGDYIGHSAHQVCGLEYYQQAIEHIRTTIENPTFFLFSDDINWVKENLVIAEKVIFQDQICKSVEELFMMQQCRHFIISNSSFSWWAQYLSDSKDKIVIAPSKWFANGNKSGVYQKNWTLINV